MVGYLGAAAGLWNLDETAFKLAEAVRSVYAERDSKEVTSFMDGTHREVVTVLVCGNAAESDATATDFV